MGPNSLDGGLYEGGDFQQAFEALTYGQTTYKNKKLPPATPAPAIPERSGSSGRIATPVATSGGADLTLAGAQTVSSTDGLITIAYPQSVTVVIGALTLTLPAIIKQP